MVEVRSVLRAGTRHPPRANRARSIVAAVRAAILDAQRQRALRPVAMIGVPCMEQIRAARPRSARQLLAPQGL
jgi:hypothetical protein